MEMTTNVLIVSRQLLPDQYLQKYLQREQANIRIVGSVETIEDAVGWVNSNEQPDFIFMDKSFAGQPDFEHFRQLDLSCPLILIKDDEQLLDLVTNSGKGSLFALSRTALLRPSGAGSSLARPAQHWPAAMSSSLSLYQFGLQPSHHGYRQHFLVRWKEQVLSIKTDQVAYFYSEGKTTFLKMNTDHVYSLNYSLEEVEHQLDPQLFFRASRKYLIARASITNIFVHFNGQYKVLLNVDLKDDLIVSKGRMPDFKEWLGA